LQVLPIFQEITPTAAVLTEERRVFS